MAQEGFKRKLTTILIPGVARDSSIMAEHEAAILSKITVHRENIVSLTTFGHRRVFE